MPKCGCVLEDHVLAVKTGKSPSRDPKPCNGKHGNTKRSSRDRNLSDQPAVLRQLLLMMRRVNHATRSQEQQRLEERVRDEMKQSAYPRPEPQCEDHVPKLREGGICQHFLDV